MRILFDHGAPKGLARSLPGHAIITAQAKGWDRLNNGALLNAAEEAGLDLLVTTDRRIRYQQNLAGRKIALAPGSGLAGAGPAGVRVDFLPSAYRAEGLLQALDGCDLYRNQ
jgi:hypothetical protein